MDEEIFLEEKDKLKEIVQKMDDEEHIIEENLSSSDMNYDLENIAKANVLQAQIKKLEDIKKIKDKPYFARMDFREDSNKLEKFYIGKISL